MAAASALLLVLVTAMLPLLAQAEHALVGCTEGVARSGGSGGDGYRSRRNPFGTTDTTAMVRQQRHFSAGTTKSGSTFLRH